MKLYVADSSVRGSHINPLHGLDAEIERNRSETKAKLRHPHLKQTRLED